MLQKVAKNIQFTESGVKALELLRNSSFDLILMDEQLPDSNGYDIVKSIRQFEKHTPIIAQTAFAMADDERKALDSGCQDYITKPINQEV